MTEKIFNPVDSGIKSLKWTSLSSIIPQVLKPFLTVWLATLIDPSAYGLVAIAAVVIGFNRLIQGMGFSEYIISSKESDDLATNTAFWSNIILGISMYILLVLLTPLIVHFYKIDDLTYILPVLGLMIIINSSGIIQQAILIKQMNFKKLFVIKLMPTVIMFCVTIPLAYNGFEVWALIIGTLINRVLENFLYWFYSKWRPSFVFSKKLFYKMSFFGKWIVFRKVLEYFYANLDVMVISYYFDLSLLGLYSVAKNLVVMTFNSINGPIGAVIFPMFSQLQDSRNKFNFYLKNILKKLSIINFPLIIGIIFLSEIGIELLFNEKWENMGLYIPIFALGLGLSKNFSSQREILQVIKRPDVYPKSIIVNFLFVAIFYPLFGDSSILNCIIIFTLNELLFCIIQSGIFDKILKIRITEQLKCFFPAFISSLFLGLSLFLMINLFNQFNIEIGLSLLLFLIVFSSLIYLTVLWIIDKNEIISIINIIKKSVSLK